MQQVNYLYLSVYKDGEWEDMKCKYDSSIIPIKYFDKIKEEIKKKFNKCIGAKYVEYGYSNGDKEIEVTKDGKILFDIDISEIKKIYK